MLCRRLSMLALLLLEDTALFTLCQCIIKSIWFRRRFHSFHFHLFFCRVVTFCIKCYTVVTYVNMFSPQSHLFVNPTTAVICTFVQETATFSDALQSILLCCFYSCGNTGIQRKNCPMMLVIIIPWSKQPYPITCVITFMKCVTVSRLKPRLAVRSQNYWRTSSSLLLRSQLLTNNLSAQ